MTVGSLIGLALGLVLGIVAHNTGNGVLLWIGSALAPLGEGWTRALLMIVIPLISSYLFVSIAGLGSGGGTARVGGLSLFWFLTLLALAGLMTAVAGPRLIAGSPMTAGEFAALASHATLEIPTAAAGDVASNPLAWIVALIPSNPVQALANGDILSVLIFVVLFALAATRLAPATREPLVGLAVAVAEASMTLVRWILVPIPLAVFALSYPMAMTIGAGIAGAVVWFIVVTCVLLLAFTVLIYPITWIFGGLTPLRFQRGAAPSQLVAVGTRSSLASLPTMLEGARNRLGLDESVANLVLPLSVSAFKVNRTITSPFKLLFLAHMYGLVISPEYLVAFVGTVILLSFSSPGIPSGGFFVTLPFYLAAGIPVEGVVLLKAVDAVPDIFKTLVNVTADLSVAAIVTRFVGRRAAAPVAPDMVMPTPVTDLA